MNDAMRWIYKIPLRLRSLFRRKRVERELNEELQFHLEKQIEENLASGMNAEEARYAALREFGGVEQMKEECRDSWGVRMISELGQDVRYGLRQLRRSPGFTVVAILTLALGIGANTAIFTLVDAVMLKSLPVVKPSQLFRLGDNGDCCVITGLFADGSVDLYSTALYKQLRNHTPEFSELAAFQPILTSLSVRRQGGSGAAEAYNGEFVSSNYFKMFGLNAFAGRVFGPADGVVGAPPVAIMNYTTWQERFGSNPSVVGSTLAINQTPYMVIGIAPPGFFGETMRSDPPDFWIPLSTEPLLNRQNSILNNSAIQWLYTIGRLRPGAVVAQVQSRLTTEARQWFTSQNLGSRDRALIGKQHVHLTPAGGGVSRMQKEYAKGLSLLMMIGGLVLLIACANVASLLLARAATSRPLTAVRAALGATHGRLIRQAVTESILLAVLGGLAGLCVSFLGARLILLIAFRGAHDVPISAAPSWPVLAFAFLVSLITGVVFGLAPAWATVRAEPLEALHGAGRSAGDHWSLARRSLVIVQVALSIVLLIGAGLLTQSLLNLQNQRFGFETQNRVVVHLNPSLAGYTPERLHGLYQQLQQMLSQIPGVRSVAFSLYGPMEDNQWSNQIFIEGRSPNDRNYAVWDRVSAHYFETIGTQLVRGRLIGEEDTPTSRKVADVNQTFARKYFPKQNPIGQHFGIADPSHAGDYEIVGIVEDTKYQDARAQPAPMFFLPFLQDVHFQEPSYSGGQTRSNYLADIELRVSGKPQNLEASVRRTLAGINPNLTILSMLSLSEQVALNFNQDRLITRLTELFAILALLLACVGLYGVTAYSVARRTHEVGIRMALGAQKGDVLGMVVKQGLRLALLGVAFGVGGALALTRFLASLLYGVKPTDPLTFVAVSLVLIIVALVACYIPARRAAKVDPMVALRYE